MTETLKVNMVLNIHRNPKGGEKGGKGWGGGGEGDYVPIATLSPPALRWAAMTAI